MATYTEVITAIRTIAQGITNTQYLRAYVNQEADYKIQQLPLASQTLILHANLGPIANNSPAGQRQGEYLQGWDLELWFLQLQKEDETAEAIDVILNNTADVVAEFWDKLIADEVLDLSRSPESYQLTPQHHFTSDRLAGWQLTATIPIRRNVIC